MPYSPIIQCSSVIENLNEWKWAHDTVIQYIFYSKWVFKYTWENKTIYASRRSGTNTVFNPSPPTSAYMLQWIWSALVQIMARRLFRAMALSKPIWDIITWTLRQWNLNLNTKLFIRENAPENIVCKMAAILSRGRWVKYKPLDLHHDKSELGLWGTKYI